MGVGAQPYARAPVVIAASIVVPPPPFDARSLTFTSASSQYLSATGKTNLNQQKFTIAFWFKRASAGSSMYVFLASDGSANNFTEIVFAVNNKLVFQGNTSGSPIAQLQPSAVISDTTTWH